MKLIKPSFEILEQVPGLEGIYEAIERAGRTCYKSKRPEGQTAKDFVDRMIASKHYAMLEHGTVYLHKHIDGEWTAPDEDDRYFWERYSDNPYSKARQYFRAGHGTDYYVSTNYRVLVENGWLSDLQYLCEPTEYHRKRITVRFTTDRGVSHEFVRHRVFSFAQESTRYCNYSANKFGNELTFIIPSWLDTIKDGDVYSYDTHIKMWQKSEDANTSNFLQSIAWAEKNYLTLLYNGWTPQQARQLLPNALKTELVMTGFVSDWNHFFDLRARGTTGAPHPDAKALAEPLMNEFVKRKLL